MDTNAYLKLLHDKMDTLLNRHISTNGWVAVGVVVGCIVTGFVLGKL